MRNVYLLLKVQLSAMWGLNKILHLKDRRERIKKLVGRIAVGLCILMIMPAFYMMTYEMASGLKKIGQLRSFPGIILAVNCLLTLISSFSMASGTLLAFRDYDMIIALPVRRWEVAASRILLGYFGNLPVDALIMLPCCVAYAYLARPAVAFYPVFLLTALAAPIVPLVVGCLIGLVISRLTASIRGAKYVQLLIAMAFMVVYMHFCMNMADYMENGQLILMGNVLGDVMNRFYPLTGLYVMAVSDLHWGAAMLFTLIGVVVMALAALALGHWLPQLHAQATATRTRKGFYMGHMKAASPMRALYRKELKRYLSSTTYLFNTAFGLLLALVGVVILLVRGRTLLLPLMQVIEALDLPKSIVAYVISYMAAFMISMSCTTSCSISLEGNQLWLVKSLPVTGMQVLMAKLLVNLTLTGPVALLVGIGAGLALELSALEMASIAAMGLSYALFSAALGLLINVKSHVFDWTTEARVIKQSASVGLTVVSGMIACIVPAVLSFVLMEHMALVFYVTLGAVALTGVGMLYIIRIRADRWLRAL